MRPYEIMYIISPKVEDEAAVEALIEKVQGMVTQGGGEITKVDKLGRRRMAYEIKGFTEGFYVVMNFNMNPAAAAELERVLKLTDEVVRYLLIRVGE